MHVWGVNQHGMLPLLGDYLTMVTQGFAETLYVVAHNEVGLIGGVNDVRQFPDSRFCEPE